MNPNPARKMPKTEPNPNLVFTVLEPNTNLFLNFS